MSTLRQSEIIEIATLMATLATIETEGTKEIMEETTIKGATNVNTEALQVNMMSLLFLIQALGKVSSYPCALE